MPELQDYKGYKVHVSDAGMFLGIDRDGHEVATAPALDDLKGKLDRMSKAKFGFDVWIDHENRFRKGRITSAREPVGYHSRSLRFRVQVGREWSEVEAAYIYKDTEENRTTFEEVNRLREEGENLRKKASALEDEAVAFTASELLGQGQ